MKREGLLGDAPQANLDYWTARSAAAEAGTLAAFEAQLALAIAQYSAGAPLEVVRASLQAAITTLEMHSDPIPLKLPEHYYPALWALSLAIIFGIPSPAFEERLLGQDLLIDRLLALTDHDIQPHRKLLFPKAMEHLIAAMDAPKTAQDAIEAYLGKLYAALGLTPWHDSHLRQNPAFFGYWAFELAAVVKALNISDKPFSHQSYYPKDIVHQRDYKVWTDDGRPKPKQVKAVKGQFEALSKIMKALWSGDEVGENDVEQAGDHLKQLGQSLLGGVAKDDPSDPDAMRLGFLQLLQAVSSIAQEASETAAQTEANSNFQAIRELEQALLADNPELAAALSEIERDGADEGKPIDREAIVQEAQTRLHSIQSSLENLLSDSSLSIDQMFAGVEALHERLFKDLGIEPEKPINIYEEVSERVGKSLDEANKKNMITKDFDWGSLWRKD